MHAGRRAVSRSAARSVESLDSADLMAFHRCDSRVFDLGYECGSESWGFGSRVSTVLLRRLAQVGGTLAITPYPEHPSV